MKRNDGGRFLSKLKLLLHSFLIKYLSVQSQCAKSLRRFSTTSASYYFWIVKAAKVKSTSFCLVSAYLPGQNIKGILCTKKSHRFFINVKDKQCEKVGKVSLNEYSHVDCAVLPKFDLADSAFIQSSLKEIINHLN